MTDINGKRIEVTNLSGAIEQAETFVDLQHKDEEFEMMDERLKIYWQDILNKLKLLQEN